MSILTDQRIREAVENGTIQIDPFNPAQVNPTSYDLTLGDEVAVYEGWTYTGRNVYQGPVGGYVEDGSGFMAYKNHIHDVRDQLNVERFKIDPKAGWVLHPGIGYLMHTRERVHTRQYVPILDGKSSIGRLFIQVHATAGFGDPGFNGQFTLEVLVQHSIRVYPGMRICQIRFQEYAGEVMRTYDQTGHYTGEAARGAIPSQAWRQFAK